MRYRTQRGSAMIIVTVLALVLAAVAAALMTEVVYRYKQTTSTIVEDEAMTICRAGLERTRRDLFVYRNNPTNWDLTITDGLAAWNDIASFNTGAGVINQENRVYNVDPADPTDPFGLAAIRANYLTMRDNGLYNTEFTNYRTNPFAADAAVPVEAPSKTDSRLTFGQNKPFRNGGYHVVVQDDGDPANDVIVVIVTATLDDGTQRQIEAYLAFDDGIVEVDNAVYSDGNIAISGSTGDVQGLEGNIHANGNIATGAGADGILDNVSGLVTATGTITPADGSCTQGAPPIVLPEIRPSDYWTADPGNTYYMQDNGIISTDPDGAVVVANVSGGGNWNGFNFSTPAGKPTWSFSGGSTPPDSKIYAIEGNFKTTGGAASDPPITATFLVTGDTDLGGNRRTIPYYADIAFMTGGDLSISGTPTSAFSGQGMFIAGDQISIAGTADLAGPLIAQNTSGSSPAISATGSFNITYDGGLGLQVPTMAGVSVQGLRRRK